MSEPTLNSAYPIKDSGDGTHQSPADLMDWGEKIRPTSSRSEKVLLGGSAVNCSFIIRITPL